MRKDVKNWARAMTRRDALSAAATFGLSLALTKRADAGATARIAAAQPGTKVCVLTPEATQGLVRADIKEGKQGAPLALTLQVVEAETCAKLKGARVDIWHSDALGLYSGYADQETGSALGETYLRGTQFTDVAGEVRFATIYPGWYPGRTPHIHFKVIVDDKDLVTGQLYFPDAVSESIYATLSSYREGKEKRDTMNANDFIFQRQDGADTLVSIEENDASYSASLVIGIARAGRA